MPDALLSSATANCDRTRYKIPDVYDDIATKIKCGIHAKIVLICQMKICLFVVVELVVKLSHLSMCRQQPRVGVPTVHGRSGG